MHRIILAIFVCAVIGLAGLPFASSADVVAVCPEKFRESLQPWIDYRQEHSLTVTVVPSQATAESLRKAIAEASDEKTKYVVLVGDAPVIGIKCDTTRQVPTAYEKTKVTAKWGSTPTLSTDLIFGDFDTDGKPDACVGRMPVHRGSDLEQLTKRIIAYEQSDNFGAWRGRVQLIGGMGGFGFVADTAIESVTRNIVTSVLPAATKTSIYYASPGHKFYPPGDSFTSAVVDQYQQGARFWVYAGHGNVTELDRVPQTRDGIPVLDARSVQGLNRPASSAPIALMLACYTGAIDAGADSLAENMLMTDGGPIAVFAGSRVTMPYGNTTAAVGLIHAVYQKKSPRLGDAWLATLKQLQSQDPGDRSTTRMMIDTLASVVSPAGTDLNEERAEHMHLYNLLGDPTLAMHPPEDLEFAVESGYKLGEPIEFEIVSPIQGKLTVSIDRPLGAATGADPNQTTIASITMDALKEKKSRGAIKLADDVVGPVIIRAIVSGKKSWATGAARSIIRRP